MSGACVVLGVGLLLVLVVHRISGGGIHGLLLKSICISVGWKLGVLILPLKIASHLIVG